jgi:hypothetical protein
MKKSKNSSKQVRNPLKLCFYWVVPMGFYDMYERKWEEKKYNFERI